MNLDANDHFFMYNIILIYPFNLNKKYTSKTIRFIQYKNCEEGIAAISFFGKLIDMVIIYEKTSFLSGDIIKYLIQKQFPYLPIFIFYDREKFTQLLQDNLFHLFLTQHIK